jgi:hypothetical protein
MLALALLKQDTTAKCGIKNERILACAHDNCWLQVLPAA